MSFTWRSLGARNTNNADLPSRPSSLSADADHNPAQRVAKREALDPDVEVILFGDEKGAAGTVARDEVDLWATDELHFQQYASRCPMWVPPEARDPVLLHHPTRRGIGYFGAVRL